MHHEKVMSSSTSLATQMRPCVVAFALGAAGALASANSVTASTSGSINWAGARAMARDEAQQRLKARARASRVVKVMFLLPGEVNPALVELRRGRNKTIQAGPPGPDEFRTDCGEICG